MELAEAIANTVSSGGSIVVKAPTGYGKTVSVIYGLLRGGARRVIYVVRTINEIDPVLRELKWFNVDYSILISARRTCPLMAKEGVPPLSHEDFWRNCTLLRIMRLCRYYERLTFKLMEVQEYLKKYPLSNALRLLKDIARHYEVCPFFAMVKLLSISNFVVATYPYIFREDIVDELFPEGLGDYVIVVDEAHNLLNAQSIVERRVTLDDLARAAVEIRRYSVENAQLATVLDGIREELVKLKRRRWSGLLHLDKNVVLGKVEDVELLERVESMIRNKLILQSIASQVTPNVTLALSKVVDWAKSLKAQDYHLFAQIEGEELTLISTPLDPMVVVKKPLENAKALVLLSGTIPQGDFLRGMLGVERSYVYYDVEMLFGPITPRSNIFTVVVTDVTSRFKERSSIMYDRIARYLAEIARGFNGIKLVVHPSYEMMHRIVERLPQNVSMVVEEPQTNIGDVETRILEEKDIVVNAVAGGKLVEGVEFVDYDGSNLLHVVVVVGVPFPQPDDYTRMRLETLSKRMGRSEASKLVYLVTAIIKVRQALGRAVRSPEDKAVFILLDHRYLRKDIKELLSIKYDRVVTGLEDFRKILESARKHLESL